MGKARHTFGEGDKDESCGRSRQKKGESRGKMDGRWEKQEK
jgi:hypothetical protein